MQLPRVVIAAVFFVIGALIAVPALMKWSSGGAHTTNEPVANSSSVPSTSPSGGGTGTPTKKGKASPTHSPTHGATPTHKPTSTPSQGGAQPLAVTFGSVDCPGRTVDVTVRNESSQEQGYSVERDDNSTPVTAKIAAGATRTSSLRLQQGRRTLVVVNDSAHRLVKEKAIKANCAVAAPGRKPTRLPHTGADSAMIWARVATGAGALLTGAIILWYGGIWPRRRDPMFGNKTAK
ncbi:hypothetical protein [Actinomadura harenae]|uniref:Uncharacterized protein n=1 Tax=Actinomadura harenae TaxID=2483351 RepID=A0A3M2M7U4_9ACTN|nr:hypothetical protein [Actinomadura harenae]RMI45707.1 hypothetical protein EBO15_08930 [Actinomadura harenae]